MEISVVVPTLNEEQFLPTLLDSLHRQRYPVHEIIVADGFSHDRTREIALKWGCRVVDGPTNPGTGRNRGAATATGDTLLFLDSDVVLPAGFIRRLACAYERSRAATATVTYRPEPVTLPDRLIALGANLGILALQWVQPMATGHCIMTSRSVFDAIGGFNERLKQAEDHDFARRAARHGPFRVFLIPLRVSTRRYVNKGRLWLVVLYVRVAIRILLGQEIMTCNPSIARMYKHPKGVLQGTPRRRGC
jgi:glycosyltransferase involved in cell wall biosynthesis